MKILIFGDIFGRPGREALARVLPQWKKQYSPDLVIANGENLSHGRGISETSAAEILGAGVGVITGGNHILEGKNADELLANQNLPVVRPINFIATHPGKGWLRVNAAGTDVLIVNAIAQTHMRAHYDSPYAAVSKLLEENAASEKTKVVILDWHAETTSEKVAMGWWLDGKASLVYGTHTHTPTADERILPQGTGFISDIGMTGPHYSVIGEDISRRIDILVHQKLAKPDVAAAPPYEVNALLAEIDPKTGKCVRIERLRQILG
ncbi:MAG: YmdB family metallophosphoesterase [Candidatus Sungbacteria bacterium]|uniref:YmdB family metallophosphoesterase n=1 Tax=Candidatus Sungiibacteriota bacterium TaxID=2750080 RepID=A0A931SBX8_9BACT|nr:YmdB family metallophosphoesterase [Candidatus Sungbacteria bacterium]